MKTKPTTTGEPDGTPTDNRTATARSTGAAVATTLDGVPSAPEPATTEVSTNEVPSPTPASVTALATTTAIAITVCPFCAAPTVRAIAPRYHECRACEATFPDGCAGLALDADEVTIDGPFRNGRAPDQCARRAPAVVLTPTAIVRAAERHGYRAATITATTIILRRDGRPSGD